MLIQRMRFIDMYVKNAGINKMQANNKNILY